MKNFENIFDILKATQQEAIEFIISVLKNDQYYTEMAGAGSYLDIAKGTYSILNTFIVFDENNPIVSGFGEKVFFKADNRMIDREGYFLASIKYAAHFVTRKVVIEPHEHRAFDASKNEHLGLLLDCILKPENRFTEIANPKKVYYSKKYTFNEKEKVAVSIFEIEMDSDGHIRYITIMPDRKPTWIDKQKKGKDLLESLPMSQLLQNPTNTDTQVLGTLPSAIEYTKTEGYNTNLQQNSIENKEKSQYIDIQYDKNEKNSSKTLTLAQITATGNKLVIDDIYGTTDMVPISEIIPYREFDRKDNPVRGENYLDKIKQHLLENGFEKPLVFNINNGKGMVVDGNHRLSVAFEIGLEYVPVKIQHKPIGINEHRARKLDKHFLENFNSKWNKAEFENGGDINNVTKLPDFIKWFNESKITYENGQPQIVYHGTNKEFDEFERTSGQFGGGMYFSRNPDDATYYASLKGSEMANVIPVYLSIQNPFYYDIYNDKKPLPPRTNLIKKGYDGVIGKTSNGTEEIVAFNSNQIKSAIGNRKFDRNNSNIIRAYPF